MGTGPFSLHNFCRGKTLLRLFPSPDPTCVGASGTGSALFFRQDGDGTFLAKMEPDDKRFQNVFEQQCPALNANGLMASVYASL
jgi:hypothetical protein